jgi:hypothetical protein
MNEDDRVQARVRDLLEEVAGAPEPVSDDRVDRVLRTARWQRTVRGSLVAVGELSSALADGLALLAGGRRR